MNNAKLWLVVKPTVGIPIFLSAVALGSLAVHVAVTSKITWYDDFVTGQPLGSSASAALAVPDAAPQTAGLSMAPGQAILVVLPDGTTARAYLDPASHPALASAAPGDAPPLAH